MKHIITTEFKNGKFIQNKNLILKALEALSGGKIMLTIQKAKKHRTSQQNRFYHGVVVVIVANCMHEAGYVMTNEDVHDMLRVRFLKETICVNEETGDYIERIKSTTELSTVEFMEYVQSIVQWVAEFFGTVIPDPEENLKLEL